MTTLILVRHGESEANLNGIFAGQYDAELSEKGLEQAKMTAKYVTSRYKIDKVYASDLKRAYKTGKCVADLLEIEPVPNRDLREISAGSWDGKRFSDIAAMYRSDYDVWLSDIGNAKCTDGESVGKLGKRIMRTLTQIAESNDGKTVLVATHATPIRVMQTLVCCGSLEKMKDIRWVSNASVSVFEYDNGCWSIASIGADAHLAELKTSLPENV